MKKKLLNTCKVMMLLGFIFTSMPQAMTSPISSQDGLTSGLKAGLKDEVPVLGSTLYFDFDEVPAPVFDQRGSTAFTDDVDNPLKDAVNPSNKVGKFTTPNNNWGSIRTTMSNRFDFSTDSTFSLLVYHAELTGMVRIELGAGTSGRKQLSVEYTTPGAWQLLTFVLTDIHIWQDSLNFYAFTFASNRTTAGEEWYFDEFRAPPTMQVYGSEVYFNFDGIDAPVFDPRGGSAFTGPVPNPMVGGRNSSANVGKFTSPGNNWGGLRATMDKKFDFRRDSIFSLLVYHPELTGNVRIELGTGSSGKKQMNQEYTTPGEWQLLTFILNDTHIWHDSLNFYAFVFGTNRSVAGEEWYFDEFRAPKLMPDEEPGELEFKIWSNFEISGLTNVEGFRSVQNNKLTATDIPAMGVEGGTVVALTYETTENDPSTGYLLWAFPTANVDGYTHLVIHAKAEEETKNVKITLRDNSSITNGTGGSYAYINISTEWKEIIIPLTDFRLAEDEVATHPNLKVLQQIRVGFEYEKSTPASGVVYLDLVGFDIIEEEPPVLGSVLFFNFEEEEADLPEFINAGATFGGVMDNPNISSRNPSAHVGMSATGSNSWDGISYYFDNTLDLRNDTIFTMLVYHPELEGRTRLQFNGPTAELKLDEYYTTPGQWQLITWRIPKSYDGMFNRVMLVFAHDRAVKDEIWYFDELRGAPLSPPDETPEKTYYSTKNFRKSWTGFDNAVYEGVTENPLVNATHMEPLAGKFITGTQNWAGIHYDLPGGVNFSKGKRFTMLVYSEHTGRVRLQLEKTSNDRARFYANYTTPGEWALLTFDSGNMDGEFKDDHYTRIVLVFDDETNVAGKAWYFDEIHGPAIMDSGPQIAYFDFMSAIEPTFRGFSGGAYIGKMFNLSPDAVNPNEFAGLSYTGGDFWSGIFFDLPSTINFDESHTFKTKIFTEERDTTGTASFGDFRIELRGTPHNNDTRFRMWHEYKDMGKWVEITLKADESSIDYATNSRRNNFYHTLLIVFDDKRRDSGHEWYFDNIVGPKLTPVYNADILLTVTNHGIAASTYAIAINDGERIPLHNDGTNGDVTADDNIWSFRINGLPVGDHVMAVYADDKLISDAATVPFTVPETIRLTRVNFDHMEDTSTPETPLSNSIIRMFPNPADAELHIQSMANLSNIAVFDIVGRMVIQASPEHNSYTMNTSQLKSGIYIIRIADETGAIETLRFIKK